MIAKVARNVIRANPKAAPTTIPATAPFESWWLDGACLLDCKFGLGDNEVEPRELLVDDDSCIF